jgi:hypothetical protein
VQVSADGAVGQQIDTEDNEDSLVKHHCPQLLLLLLLLVYAVDVRNIIEEQLTSRWSDHFFISQDVVLQHSYQSIGIFLRVVFGIEFL